LYTDKIIRVHFDLFQFKEVVLISNIFYLIIVLIIFKLLGTNKIWKIFFCLSLYFVIIYLSSDFIAKSVSHINKKNVEIICNENKNNLYVFYGILPSKTDFIDQEITIRQLNGVIAKYDCNKLSWLYSE
jgi:hypothetical protein